MVDEVLLHATCVSVAGVGVILFGPPGSGKSDLALRLIDQPGCGISGAVKPTQLVADDQVAVKLKDGKLIASAPPTISGLIEIRGLGLVGIARCAEVSLSLAVQLTANALIERAPDSQENRYDILGTSLPIVCVDPTSASAPSRVRAAVDWLERL
jgi:serine kinase of HPr protein (carbohydrate metabolism regulator)